MESYHDIYILQYLGIDSVLPGRTAMKYRINVPGTSLRSRSVTFKVVLLDNSELAIKFDRKKVLCSELFEKVCDQAKISPLYRKYFGIKYINSEDAKPSWLHLEETIKSSLTITAVFQFAIKVFPKSINDVIEDPIFLKHVVYQIKYLFLHGKLRTSIQEHAILDSYFAQAILGDFNTKKHNRGYLESKLGSHFYSAQSSLNSDGEVSAAAYERKVTYMHKNHHGMTRDEALIEYLNLSISVFGYGAFTYKEAVDLNDKEFILAISQRGIQIFLPNHFGEPDEIVHEYPWDVVTSIMSDGSRFLFSVCSKSGGQRSNSLQTHSFRFPGYYGHLQAQRIEKDAINHRNFVIGPQITGKRQTRSKSLDDISKGLERLLPGRQIDRRLVQSFKLSKLKCFHEKIRKAKTAYSTLPKTKARDNVIRKLTEIDFQIKDLYAQLHRAQQAISPCGSAQQSVCTMTGPTHTATKRTSQQVAKHLFKVLSDLHGELRAMGVDFKKLRKTCPVASVQPAVGQSKPLPCL